MIGFDKLEPDEPEEKQCKGVIWRASTSAYFDGTTGAMIITKRLKVLKRKSCPGCESCGGFFDFMNEDVYAGADDWAEKYLDDIENGKMYTFKIYSSQDWETGIYEIDRVEFVEVKE